MGEVYCHLDKLLEERGITLSALAQQVGVTAVNLSVLKNNRAKAVRFSTLAALCEALDCQPGDLFSVRSSS
ncbi:helix-turn-helix transcriptional regulator [Corynebacterium durum]|jgi:transcription regulator, cro/CI family-related protein|uniref:helix-turn-helix domain-containing protein n=1 Tax=Corynebacterium durum TaxID=61592 RepID=UPI0026DD1B7A|nr:helix-turn-helix transcriptional regulator [Corynebacterium durum]MDO4653260.1 helix-turn-helix transcriptional regulator [Corynebacterium durum]